MCIVLLKVAKCNNAMIKCNKNRLIIILPNESASRSSSSGYALDCLRFSWLVVNDVPDPVEPSRTLRLVAELSPFIFKNGLQIPKLN